MQLAEWDMSSVEVLDRRPVGRRCLSPWACLRWTARPSRAPVPRRGRSRANDRDVLWPVRSRSLVGVAPALGRSNRDAGMPPVIEAQKGSSHQVRDHPEKSGNDCRADDERGGSRSDGMPPKELVCRFDGAKDPGDVAVEDGIPVQAARRVPVITENRAADPIPEGENGCP